MKCSNCGYEHNEDYCPACGKSKITTVINYEELEAEERNLAKNKKIVIFTCIAIILVFASYIILNANDNNSDKAIKVSTNEKTDPYGTLGDYFVEIISGTTIYDYAEEPAIIIKYSYTNNSYEAVSFLMAFDCKVYQDGVECGTAILGYDSPIDIDTDKYYLDVKPGTTTDIQIVYSLYNFDSDVDVEIRERYPLVRNPYDVVKMTFHS